MRDERPIKGAPTTALTSSPGRVARPWDREGGGTQVEPGGLSQGAGAEIPEVQGDWSRQDP